ncbi:hypothetical protein [Geminocystis sp. NIES-3709]|uniref:hypothetical protein n=1 Tax=Geminocystis sp. NIES-3709 TaxID=1617448 RepID=UPI0005FCA920|nr:hypothetical protein [Geminocystis sp. NIES-3709]BAQ66989.1 hypothetical protein GM3709_3754 [Geminocystis sp. NIES-3709]
MFLNFAEFSLKVGETSFVGCNRSQDGSGFDFNLPNGFEKFKEEFDKNNSSEKFNQVRDLFFLMYRVLRKFEQDNLGNGRFKTKDTNSNKTQDKTMLSQGGKTLEPEDDEDGDQCILYSKITQIEKILEAYDELAIYSIQKRVRRTEEIDYAQIHKYLDRAIYLDYSEEDHVIHIESMDLPRLTIHYESTDIIKLYCFILYAIIEQLQEDVPENVLARTQEIRFLAEQFRDEYLTHDQSLFDSDSYEETILILKEVFDNIDRNTHYKDPDYWQFYEAIETFLYGSLNSDSNDGEFWGIKGQQGFSYVWEDMCQTYFFKKYFDSKNDRFKICFADTDIVIENYKNEKRNKFHINDTNNINRVGNVSRKKQEFEENKKDKNSWFYCDLDGADNAYTLGKIRWQYVFCIQFNLNKGVYENSKISRKNELTNIKFRYPTPDLVLQHQDLTVEIVEIIDFKNVSMKFFMENKDKPIDKTEKKYRIDVIKQLEYEFALQEHGYEVKENRFFIPYYYDIEAKSEGEYADFDICGIKIFKANFYYILNVYLGTIVVKLDFKKPQPPIDFKKPKPLKKPFPTRRKRSSISQ